MAIVLFIIKLIGKILLWVLIVAVGLLAYLLFLPFHYQLRGNFPEDRSVDGSIRILSCLHFWQIAVQKENGEFGVFLSCFWGKCRLFPPKQKEKRAEDNRTEEMDTVFTKEEQQEILEEQRQESCEYTEPKKSDTSASKEEETEEIKQPQQEKRQKKKKKKASSDQKKKDNFLQNFHNTFHNEHNKKAVNFILQKMIWLLKKGRPKALHADIEFSLGDPALTGTATGVLSLCPACYGRKTRIYPDFQREEIYALGWIEIKGIVFLAHIVYLIISILLHEECRKMLFQ